MDSFVTGAIIRRLRESRRLTQSELVEKLGVSDKSVSKWETGRGYPDITLLEPIAAALGISVPELLSGQDVTNRNRAGNMLRSRWYVCPVCGNILFAAGEAVVSCCGITLPPLEPEEPDAEHTAAVECVEDEYYVSLPHEMTRTHRIGFVAAVGDDGVDLHRLYPEGDAGCRVKRAGTRYIVYYCSRHGFFRQELK